MSVSSGSDVTIPIQDSPPPPPSPYANNGKGKGGQGTPRGDVVIPTGIENKAYSPSDSEKGNINKGASPSGSTKKKGDHMEVNVGGDVEAVNPELINMSIMSTIPAKPQSEFGPYEQMDDYFIPVNQHKKFLSRRSEKLYVTKDKRKEGGWKKCLCWTFAAFILAAIVAVAILVAVGVIPQGSESEGKLAQVGDMSTTPSSILDIIGLSSSTTSAPSTSEDPSTSIRPTRPVDDTHVTQAAKATFDITSLTFEAALANKSSVRFHELASQVQDEMKKVLLENANLDNVTVRVDEFEPGSVHVKMFLSWAETSMDLEHLQRTLMGKTTLGNFSIGPVALYNIVNHCKFNNNNGCSHVCKYDYSSLEFSCSCPETLTLGSDKKTCEAEGGAAEEPQPESEPPSPQPEEQVSSSPEPSVEPEAAAPEPETQAEPEPTVGGEEEKSSVDSELGDVSTSSSTTAGPRLDLEVDLTTEAPEPEPEVPVEPEIVSLSSTTTSTTETPLLPLEVENEDVAVTTVSTPKESHEEAGVASEERHLLQVALTTEATPVEEFPAHSSGESETERPSAVPIQHGRRSEETINVEEDSVFVHEAAPSSSMSTTTTTSTSTEVPAIVGETHLEQREEDQLTSNLQRESVEAVALGLSDEAPTETPTGAPTHDDEMEIVQLTKEKASEEVEASNSTSSERNGRQESSFGSNSVEELPEVVTTPPLSTESAPNSGEFMVYSDNRRASQQSGSSESAESSDTRETVDVLNPIELPALEPTTSTSTSTSAPPTSSSSIAPPLIIPVVPVEREIEETTTIRPISLEKDIDVNNEAGVTEDSVHTEEVETSSGSGELPLPLPSLTAESSDLSVETEEVELPNRDHRNANLSEETTISPVVFDDVESEAEGVTTDSPVSSSSSSTTTTTTSPPSSSSTEVPLITNSTILSTEERGSGDNESENELH